MTLREYPLLSIVAAFLLVVRARRKDLCDVAAELSGEPHESDFFCRSHYQEHFGGMRSGK